MALTIPADAADDEQEGEVEELRRLTHMNLEDLDLVAAAGRYPFQITDRLDVVVMTPVEDVVIDGDFFDGELVRMTEEPTGEA